MKQEVDLPTRYIITHVILMKQDVDLPTNIEYTCNSNEAVCRFTQLIPIIQDVISHC